MLERKDIFMGKRVNTPYGLGMITVMPYNEHTDTVFVELDRVTFDYFPKDFPQKFVVVSFKMMEEPEFAPVPEKIRNNKVFRYHAYRFIPAGTFKDFGVKDDFYDLTDAKEDDVFYCIETGKFYVPGENELFSLNMKCVDMWMNN